MQFLSTLTIAVFCSASLLANANPVKRQASNQSITITNMTVQIIGDSAFANEFSFNIQTSSENITCAGDDAQLTACTSDESWDFILFANDGGSVNLTVSTVIDGLTVSGDGEIDLYCRGVPGAAVETEECVPLASVEENGLPTTITLT